MKKLSNPSRVLALFTAGVLTAGVMLQAAPAHADKSKTYKYGAIALGALGAYMLSKGKTVAGVAVLGAGAYAYKKGEDTRKSESYGDYRNRYGYRNGNNNSNRYKNNYNGGYNYNSSYDTYYNGNNRYNVPPRNRLSDRDDNSDSGYRAYRSDDRYYDNRNDDRYNELHPKIR